MNIIQDQTTTIRILRAEVERLRKIFDDAGHGEHNVLALVEHYQQQAMDADERLRAVRVRIASYLEHQAASADPLADVWDAARWLVDDIQILLGDAP